MTIYKMPSGEYTNSAKKYVAQWRKITDCLVKKYGVQIIGFDPGILIRTKEGAVVDMPVSFAKQITGTSE